MYRIFTGSLNGVLSQVETGRRVFCVADRNALEKNASVAALVEKISSRWKNEAGLQGNMADAWNGLSCEGGGVYVLDAVERNKCIETVLEIVAWLLGRGADRDALILGIGGGILTDIVGFTAAIYKRGIDCAFVPTTLLAQVDAAVGGKNGVNFHGLKNMLGTIRQPLFTWLSMEVLTSLLPEVWRAGSAELLKTFVIEDGGNYAGAVELLAKINAEMCAGMCLEDILSECGPELMSFVEAAAKVKADIVARDEFERRERRNLNLGHTFAHAVETLALRGATVAFHGMTGCGESPCAGAECSGGAVEISHGAAVAMGVVMAAELAEKISGKGFQAVSGHSGAEEEFCCEKGLAERLRADFEKCGLPVDCPYALSEMVEIMKCDKKSAGGSVRFVLPAKIGKVMTVALRPEDVAGNSRVTKKRLG